MWFDEGGWVNDDLNGSNVAPAQGSYNTVTNSWTKASNGKDSWDYFIDKLTVEINRQTGGNYTFFAPGKGWVTDERYDALKDDFKQSIINAVNRNNSDTKTGRVVGVAITYQAFKNLQNEAGTASYGDRWYIAITDRNKSFTAMMGIPTSTELQDKYGWGSIVSKTDTNGATGNDTWRQYVYKRSAADKVARPANTGTLEWQIYVVAVCDNEPDTNGYIKLKKISSNINITG